MLAQDAVQRSACLTPIYKYVGLYNAYKRDVRFGGRKKGKVPDDVMFACSK